MIRGLLEERLNAGSQAGLHAAVDTYIEEQMRRLRIPGLSLAIVEDDAIVRLRGFGRARPGGKAPSPQTSFPIGSLTKSFTALAVMQLVEAGKVEIDAPVQHYLPWFRVADRAASAEITVRHLLNQTSGLPSLPGLLFLADFDDSPDATERQVRTLSSVRLKHSVGSAFEYSNVNYNVLGLVIETASGISYTDYLRAHVLAPLRMSHTYATQAETKCNDRAVGHQYWFAHPVPVPDMPMPRGSLPSGQLISTAEDMARYLISHLNGGRCGGERGDEGSILSESGIEELHRGAAEYRVMGTSLGRYAMGWFVSDNDATKIVWHSGTVPDFGSFMALLPEVRRGLVLLMNADHFLMNPVYTELGMGVAALVAGRRPRPSRFGFIAAVPWAMRALPVVPALQVGGAAATTWRLRRLDLALNLAIAVFPAYLARKKMLRFMRLFAPDVLCVALLSGGLAALSALRHIRLSLRAFRRRRMA